VSVRKRTNFNQARNAIFTIEPPLPDTIAPAWLKNRFFFQDSSGSADAAQRQP
jgi:hypothetical protein